MLRIYTLKPNGATYQGTKKEMKKIYPCIIPSQVPSSTLPTPEITIFDRQEKIGDFSPFTLATTLFPTNPHPPAHTGKDLEVRQMTRSSKPTAPPFSSLPLL